VAQMSKWLDAARARNGLKASERPDNSDISDKRTIDPTYPEPIVANVTIVPPVARASTKQEPVPALPPLVQAVLDQWPGAEIVAVRRDMDRHFEPAADWWTDPHLTYAQASAEVTASLPPPEEMTEAWARQEHRAMFGPCRFF
jgi:hypothetical protein